MTTPLKAVAAGGNSAELREWVAGDLLPVSMGGTGGTTAATARTGLGLGSAAVAAILGTVSQSGGVPTGAIIQRGSNANGEFVRFADGTMICQHTYTEALNMNTQASGFYFAAQGWTYPSTFIVAPQVIPQTRIGSLLTPMAPGDSTTTLCNFFPLSLSSQSGTATTRVVAIGRWF